MSVRQASRSRLPFAAFGIAGLGVFVGAATLVALNLLTPVKLAFALGGCALLIPTMVVKDPKRYWLFLLVLSIPFDISKWMSAWLVDPQTLVDRYGMPASGTVSLELYLSDAILIVMLLPWLARLCLRRERLYFPKISYIFVFYLAWALIVSLANAQSLYLSIVEMCREALYFAAFLYLINNVDTQPRFRSVVVAIFLGLIVGAGSVITFFEMGIGTETIAFASLHDQQPETDAKAISVQKLTLGQGSEIKRSQGMFRHPGVAASFLGLTLPIVLAYLMAARKNRDRILLFVVFAWGFTALVLTFSRAGLVGLIGGTVVFFTVGGWSRLISRTVLKLTTILLALAVVLSVPLLVAYLNTRPASFSMRFNLFEVALQSYAHHPILGAGLNNGTAAMQAGKQQLRDEGIQMPAEESVDNHYLAVLTEVGPVGFILFFVFFAKIVMIALRSVREEATTEMKPVLVGMVAGMASLATQNLADDALAGHAISGMLWLFAALIVAIARRVETKKRVSPANKQMLFRSAHPATRAAASQFSAF